MCESIRMGSVVEQGHFPFPAALGVLRYLLRSGQQDQVWQFARTLLVWRTSYYTSISP